MDITLGVAPGFGGSEILVEVRRNGNLTFAGAASSGARSALLFFFWMKRFPEVSLLYVDGLESFDHFGPAGKMVGKLKEHPAMQALFTSHNTSLLSNTLMRPDCILVFKDGRLGSFADLAQPREIREGNNLEKIYRSGGLSPG